MQPDRQLRARRPPRRLRAHRAQDHRRHLRRHGPPRRRRLQREGPDEGRPLRRVRRAPRRQERGRGRARRALRGAGRLRRSASPGRSRSWSRRSAPPRSTPRSSPALVQDHFDLRPAAIIERLDLRRPIYQKTAAYGHFGRPDQGSPGSAPTRPKSCARPPRRSPSVCRPAASAGFSRMCPRWTALRLLVPEELRARRRRHDRARAPCTAAGSAAGWSPTTSSPRPRPSTPPSSPVVSAGPPAEVVDLTGGRHGVGPARAAVPACRVAAEHRRGGGSRA